jgi:hypothetical protein
MSIKQIIAGLAVTPLVAALALPLTAFAATTITVTPSNTQGWAETDTRPGGEVHFVSDTSAPGEGALQLKTDASDPAKAQYMHAADNVAIGDVTNLSYAAKQVSSSFPEGQASYQLPVNLNGTSGFTTFVYEPYNQEPAGDVTPGTWQTWDVAAGRMWSSRTVTCGDNTINAGGGGAPFYTLSQIKEMCPEAQVIGFGVNVGTTNPSYDVYVDTVAFNDTTYDFEPTITVANKEACKEDGWKASNMPVFKNQGDCVSYFASAKTSTYRLDSANKSGLNVQTKDGYTYAVTVKGTWTNRTGEVVDAECTNTQSGVWANAVNGGYSTDTLDTQINQKFVDWGTCDATNHTYTHWVSGDGGKMNLRVFDGDANTNTQYDGWYDDNVGVLDVTVVAYKK